MIPSATNEPSNTRSTPPRGVSLPPEADQPIVDARQDLALARLARSVRVGLGVGLLALGVALGALAVALDFAPTSAPPSLTCPACPATPPCPSFPACPPCPSPQERRR